MGLLTDIVNSKVQEKARENFAAKQAQIAFYQNAMKPEVNPDPQDRQYAEQQLLKLLPPEGKQTHQRGSALANFFHNVVGHRDPEGYGQPQGGGALPSPVAATPPASANNAPAADTGGENFGPLSGAQPKQTGLGQQSAAVQPVRGLASPLGDTAFSDKPTGPSGSDANLGAAPNAAVPQPSPAGALAAPPIPQPSAPPAQPKGATPGAAPAFHSLYSNNTPQKVAAQRKIMAESVLGPGQEQSPGYQEIMAGLPPSSIAQKAQIDAKREGAFKTIDELKKRGVVIPDALVAELAADRNLGIGGLMRPTWASKTVNGAEIPDGTLDMFGHDVDKSKDYAVRADAMGNREYMPAEIAARNVQIAGGGMGAVNPMRPGEGATPITGAVAPSQNRVIQSDLVGGGRGTETAGEALQGQAPTPTPGTIGRGNPVSNTTQRIVTLEGPEGQRAVAVPVTGTRQVGGAAPTAPLGTAPNTPTARPAPQGFPGGGNSPSAPPASGLPPGARVLGNKGLTAQQIQNVSRPLNEAATQLFGDPQNPSFPALNRYEKLADDPGARQRLGQSLQLTFAGINDATEGGSAHISANAGPVSVSTGGIGTVLSNYFGVPQAAAAGQQKIREEALQNLKSPQEREAYDAIVDAFSSIVALRAATKALGSQSSVMALERDIPAIGWNTTDSAQFRDKMARLAEYIYQGRKGLPAGTINTDSIDSYLGRKPSPSGTLSAPKSDLKSKSTDELLKMLK